jgi:outer membrane protein assembly factor BamA
VAVDSDARVVRTVLASCLVLCAAAPAGAQASSVPDAVEGRIIREIRISPVSNIRTADLIRRHLASRQGEPLEARSLEEDYRRLDALRLFSSIEVQAIPEGDEVVLDVQVRETMKLLPFVALSVTDENGASAGPAFRGINIFGYGTLSAATTKFGGATTVDVRIERPTVTPGLWSFLTQGTYQSRRNELFEFDEKTTTVTAKAGWNATGRVQMGGRIDLTWVDTGSSAVALSADGRDTLPSAGVFLAYNSIDSLTNPREGWFGQVDVQHLSGDANSWALTLDGRRHQPIGARSTLSFVMFGVLQSGEVGSDLPEYNQFGIGGGNSVRGWSLGSRIGNNQAIGTAEYLFTVLPVRPFTVFGLNLYAGLQTAAFGDLGLAWTGPASLSDAIGGYGIGLRLLFPFIDVIRLDLAFGEPGGGAAFTFGISLKADKQRDRVR